MGDQLWTTGCRPGSAAFTKFPYLYPYWESNECKADFVTALEVADKATAIVDQGYASLRTLIQQFAELRNRMTFPKLKMKIEALLKSGAHVYEPGTMYPYPFIWLIYNDYDPEETKEIAKLLVEYRPPFPVTYQWPWMWTKEP